MLFPDDYLEMTKYYAGKFLNHDDSIKPIYISRNFEKTKSLWEENYKDVPYSEVYLFDLTLGDLSIFAECNLHRTTVWNLEDAEFLEDTEENAEGEDVEDERIIKNGSMRAMY